MRGATQEEFEPGITPFRNTDQSFVFLPTARNISRRLAPAANTTIPDEPNPPTSAVWKPRPTSEFKYVDDSTLCTRINTENVDVLDGKKTKHAVQTENVFRRVVRNAEEIGMKINEEKIVI